MMSKYNYYNYCIFLTTKSMHYLTLISIFKFLLLKKLLLKNLLLKVHMDIVKIVYPFTGLFRFSV